MHDKTKNEIKSVLESLKYLAASPSPQWSGFSPEVVEIAKAAIKLIKKMRVKRTVIKRHLQDSARLWCEQNTGEAEISFDLIVDFLEDCNPDYREVWLYRGWGKIWERIQDNLEIVPHCNERRKPITATSNED